MMLGSTTGNVVMNDDLRKGKTQLHPRRHFIVSALISYHPHVTFAYTLRSIAPRACGEPASI